MVEGIMNKTVIKPEEISILPQFPNFKPVAPEDRQVFNLFYSRYHPNVSEYCFTSLFTWRHYYNVFWCIFENQLLKYVMDDHGNYHAGSPIGIAPRYDAVKKILDYLKYEKGVSNPRIAKADIKLVSELPYDEFLITPDRDQYDYVYLTSDLIELKGRKFHAKKNHLNRFLRNYDYKFESINSENLDGCFQILRNWCNYKNCATNIEMQAECTAAWEMLCRFEELELTGIVIKIKDEVKAFSVGEMLNSQMAVIHVEKADHEIPELYTAINQLFCQNFWKRAKWVNREQDLGDEGLRKAKESYQPAFMVEKYNIAYR